MSRAGAAPPPVGRPRLAVLDGLRLLAAVSVALFHYSVAWRVDGVHPPEYHLPTSAHVAAYGFLGVELFFLISGFVICMSSWGRPLGDFFVSRVSRLYPAYWACILITAVVLVIVPISGGLPPQSELSITDIVVNFTMLQQPMGVPHVDTVYWTLFTELRFYLLFAVVVWIGLTYRRAVLFCAVWLTVAILAPTLGSPLVSMLTLPEYAPYFVAGVAMFLIHRFGPSPLLFAIVGFAWLVSLQRVELRVADIKPGFAVPTWPGAVVITAAYAVMLVVALGWTDRITWRWLTVAGAVTYPFYLLHQRIGYSMIRTTYLATGLPVWLLIVLTIAVIAAVAWLLHRFVERPLARVLRSALRRSIDEVRRAEPGAAQRGDAVAHAGGTPERVTAHVRPDVRDDQPRTPTPNAASGRTRR